MKWINIYVAVKASKSETFYHFSDKAPPVNDTNGNAQLQSMMKIQ